MIPRRRLPLSLADAVIATRSLCSSPAAASAEVNAFEKAFAAHIDVPHAIATASGRDALCLIIDALGLRRDDEIVVPAYTLGELLPLLAARGLRCVPADIDPTTFCITIESVRQRLGPRTRAIVALHPFGAPCDAVGLSALAKSHGIALVEDCAHAAGATVAGRPVGSIGDAALFSLEANKALAAYGGGVITTRDPRLAARIRAALSQRPQRHGVVLRKYVFKLIEETGVRSPLYALAARLLFAPQRAGAFETFYRRANQRVRVPAAFTAVQARWASRRLHALADREARLAKLWELFAANLPPGWTLQERERHGMPVFFALVARFDGDIVALRQAAQRHGLDLGIGAEVMDDCARLLGDSTCPGAAAAFRSAVLIPCWEGMTTAMAKKVLARLHAATADVT